MEITAQTSSEESVIVTEVRIANLVRKALPQHGITLGLGGCGGGVEQ